MSRVLLLRRLAAVVIAAGAIGSCTYATNSATPEQVALERYIERTHATQLEVAGITRIAVREERRPQGLNGVYWVQVLTVSYRDGQGTNKATGQAPDRPGRYVTDKDATIVNCRSRFSGLICLVRGPGFTVQADIDPVKLTANQGEGWMDAIVESAMAARNTKRQAQAEWRKVGTD